MTRRLAATLVAFVLCLLALVGGLLAPGSAAASTPSATTSVGAGHQVPNDWWW